MEGIIWMKKITFQNFATKNSDKRYGNMEKI